MTNAIEALTFRRATEADIPFLLELRRRTMSEHLRNSGIEPSESELRNRVLVKFDCAELILLAGAPIGLLKVVKQPNEWHLLQIQIVPERQGRGLGSAIIEKLLADAVQTHVTVSLSVLRTNPARELYQRLGFRVVEQNDHAYDMEFGAV